MAAARLIEMLHMRAAVVRRHATGLPGARSRAALRLVASLPAHGRRASPPPPAAEQQLLAPATPAPCSPFIAMRCAEELTLDLRDLVPGDLVVLRGGQLVPADVRLLACRHLFLGCGVQGRGWQALGPASANA